MRTLLASLRIVVTIIVLAVFVGILLLLTAILGYNSKRGYWFRRAFTGVALIILGVKLEVEGSIPEMPVLYASNHRSLLDPFIQLNRIDAFIVSKAEVGRYPLFGVGARATGVIFVEREKSRSRAGVREQIHKCLLAGTPVLIYPEGTTSNLETTREFKIGSFVVAAGASIPVVPVAIEYKDPNDRWQDTGMVSFFLRKFGKWQTKATLSIGNPIVGGDPEQLMQSARKWINDHLQALHSEHQL